MVNITDMMNGEKIEMMTESQIAINKINETLDRFAEVNDGTDFYATTLINMIVPLKDNIAKMMDKWEVPHKELKVLLEYLRELEQIIQIKSKVWYRHTPANDVVFEDDI